MGTIGLISNNTIIGSYISNGNVNRQSCMNMINTHTVPQLHARYVQGRNGGLIVVSGWDTGPSQYCCLPETATVVPQQGD